MQQSEALNILRGGASAFVSGPPGSGKSFLIEQFIAESRHRRRSVAVTASTGIAASLIGGLTIQSWSGIGRRETLDPQSLKIMAGDSRLVSRALLTNCLIIDEVSMLSGSFFSALDQLLRLLRATPAPFGGIQLILVGDFFQLPPVGGQGLIFETVSWRELKPVVCYLTTQHRIKKEDQLQQVLAAIREQSLRKWHLDFLLSRQLQPVRPITALVTHNSNAEQINGYFLRQLYQPSRSFTMVVEGSIQAVAAAKKTILASSLLELKAGAKIIFVANNPKAGYVNGSQGIVVGFHRRLPKVELLSGKTITVEPYEWQFDQAIAGNCRLIQLPLKLAWAITIHKSQGMSLDEAFIDLRRSFSYGMGYVALSRLRSYQGLYLKGINSRSLAVDPRVTRFYRQLKVY